MVLLSQLRCHLLSLIQLKMSMITRIKTSKNEWITALSSKHCVKSWWTCSIHIQYVWYQHLSVHSPEQWWKFTLSIIVLYYQIAWCLILSLSHFELSLNDAKDANKQFFAKIKDEYLVTDYAFSNAPSKGKTWHAEHSWFMSRQIKHKLNRFHPMSCWLHRLRVSFIPLIPVITWVSVVAGIQLKLAETPLYHLQYLLSFL